MSRQPSLVAPYTGVAYDNAVFDSVLRIVDFFRGICIDNLHFIAVGDEGLSLLIYPDGALKDPVNRISAQEARALLQVVLRLPSTHDYRAQP